MQLTSPAQRKVGLRTKLAYGFGSIAYGIKDNGFQTLLLLYYNQIVGLRADLVGLAILIALVLDAFVDPIVGHFSDHTRAGWGRRHPFMYAAAVPVGLLYLLLWNPPTGNQTVTLIYLVGVAIAVRTAISCYEVPSSALAPELTADYAERTSVLGYRYLFGWAGGMVMTLLTFIVLLAPTPQYPNGQLNPAGYHTYAWIAAIAMTAAILISSLGTHDQIRHLPRANPERTSLGETFRGIGRTLGNRAFLMLFVSGIFGFTAQGLTFALSVYVNTYFWVFPAKIVGLFIVAVMAGVVIAFGIASFGTRKWGKRPTGVTVMVLYPIFGVLPFVMRFAGLYPVNGDPLLFPLLMLNVAIATSFGVAGSILGASMMSDVVEDAQQQTGRRSEGLYFAGMFFMQKCVSGLGLYLTGVILALVHFPTGATPGTVKPEVLRNLVTTYGGALVALGLLAAYFVHRFPLGGRAEHERRLAELARAESHAAPLPGSESEFPGEELTDRGGRLNPAE
ncbi:sodium:melibiose symporter [Sphingomonas sp. CL5.1]|uniref:MFS transporter n=1 Tax=Sphingomonas sp. CL5.1 TaxID=2653203 RepID=UPI00158244EC|nr:MFS transporter [Sphingomonas sp. CL5.1]QKR99907.1 sodium:melibiose symporter [Sphingomonas sp. CL5.1]